MALIIKKLKRKRKAWYDYAQKRLELSIKRKRPVTPEDYWCRIKTFLKEDEKNLEAPNGYVIIIQKYHNYMDLSKINGVILRSKLIDGKIYLQVVEGKNRQYSIRIKKHPNGDIKKKVDKPYLIIKRKEKRKF